MNLRILLVINSCSGHGHYQTSQELGQFKILGVSEQEISKGLDEASDLCSWVTNSVVTFRNVLWLNRKALKMFSCCSKKVAVELETVARLKASLLIFRFMWLLVDY